MPEDERVAGEARVNVPGSPAEPVGDGFRDRGSLLVPVGEFAELARRPARSTGTRDLSASVRSNRHCGEVGRVLNLCDGGMLVESSRDRDVAETVGFELVGPGCREGGRQTATAGRGGGGGGGGRSQGPGKVGITPPTMSDFAA